MNKILVSICIPIINIEVDLWIPNNRKVGILRDKVFDLIKNQFDFNNYQILRLVDRFTGEEFDSDLLISQSNIKNGTKLILI